MSLPKACPDCGKKKLKHDAPGYRVFSCLGAYKLHGGKVVQIQSCESEHVKNVGKGKKGS